MPHPLRSHDRAFITDGAHHYAYADLDAHCASIGVVVAERGVEAEACIALYCSNTLLSTIAILSLLKRRAGFVLCSRGQPAPIFCHYVVHCDVTADSSQDTPSAWEVGHGLHVEENPAWRKTDISYTGRFYARTSGTTADAKIAMFSQEKLWANARNCVDRFQLSDRDRVVIPVPVAHMYGLAAAFLPAVLAESSVDIQADSNILRYLQRETEFEPTVAYLTPTFCCALVRVRRTSRRYRLTVVAGDKTPPETFERYERLHGCLVSLYGSTELGAVAAGSPDETFDLRCHSVGHPMPGVSVSNGEDGVRAEGGVSELWFTHPAGGEGYADNQGEVNRKDDHFAEGRFRSKDMGCVGEDGYLRVVGRSDHAVKRDGLLVSFSEVEGGLLKDENIEAAVVLSDGITPRGARLTAVCVLRSNGIDERAIREQSRNHLPGYAVPDRVVLVNEIPRLQSGKPDRPTLLRYLVETLGEGNAG